MKLTLPVALLILTILHLALDSESVRAQPLRVVFGNNGGICDMDKNA
jgi:hypothetical protein